MHHRPVWNKGGITLCVCWARMCGYRRVIFVGCDYLDNRYFYLGSEQGRVIPARDKKGYVKRDLDAPHPAYKKIVRWFDEHCYDMEFYVVNPKSKLLQSKAVKLWSQE